MENTTKRPKQRRGIKGPALLVRPSTQPIETVNVLLFQAFCATVRCGSMSAAAETLNESPAVISKRVSELESALGQRLLARSTRVQELTEAGRKFYDAIVPILEALRSAAADVGCIKILPVVPVSDQGWHHPGKIPAIGVLVCGEYSDVDGNAKLTPGKRLGEFCCARDGFGGWVWRRWHQPEVGAAEFVPCTPRRWRHHVEIAAPDRSAEERAAA